MEKFWEMINLQPEESTRERQIELFGELYFTPKDCLGELDMSQITIEDLKALYNEIEKMPTTEDDVLVSDLSQAKLSLYAEALVRKNAVKHTWMVNSKQVKKRFF